MKTKEREGRIQHLMGWKMTSFPLEKIRVRVVCGAEESRSDQIKFLSTVRTTLPPLSALQACYGGSMDCHTDFTGQCGGLVTVQINVWLSS